MWVMIVKRKNLGMPGNPKLGVKLQYDGALFMPGDGTILKSAQGRYRVRRKPEYGDYVELIGLDVLHAPHGDKLEVEPEVPEPSEDEIPVEIDDDDWF